MIQMSKALRDRTITSVLVCLYADAYEGYTEPKAVCTTFAACEDWFKEQQLRGYAQGIDYFVITEFTPLHVIVSRRKPTDYTWTIIDKTEIEIV